MADKDKSPGEGNGCQSPEKEKTEHSPFSFLEREALSEGGEDEFVFSLKELGDYSIEGEIGRGSMGIVYKARHKKTSKIAALKVLPSHYVLSYRTVQRFLRESESLFQLKHENIVPIYDVGRDGDVYYYAMELIDGKSMDSVMRERKLSYQEIAYIIVQAARGLEFAHSRGVIHRDIKPSNLILDKEKRVYLTDFGLARIDKASTLTESGAIVGTPIYMSPEQIKGGKEDIDFRTDIYSLGVTLYEMLSSKPPFEAETAQALLHKIVEEDPPYPRSLNPSIPYALELITRKCMEKDPSYRYRSSRELREDLERFLSGKMVRARPTGTLHRFLRKVARSKGYLAIIGVLFLVISVLGVFSFFSQKKNIAYMEKINEARQFFRDGLWDAAVQKLNEAASLFPHKSKVYLEKGKVLLGKGIFLTEEFDREKEKKNRSEEALSSFRENALSDIREALGLLNHAVSLEPEEGEGCLYRGIGYTYCFLLTDNREDLGCAEPDLQRALEYFSDSGNISLASTAHLAMGDFLLAKYDFVGANREYEEAMRIDPFNSNALICEGRRLEKLGYTKRAKEIYERAIKLNQTNPRAHEHMKHVCNKIGDVDTAKEAEIIANMLRRPVEVLRDGGKEVLEESPLRKGLDTGAEVIGDWFEKISDDIKQNPEDAKQLLLRAKLCIKIPQNYALAIQDLQRALELEPSWSEPRLMLAEIFLNPTDPEYLNIQEGLKHVEMVFKAEPENPRALKLLALALYHKKEYAKAMDAIEKALTSSPEDVDEFILQSLKENCKKAIESEPY